MGKYFAGKTALVIGGSSGIGAATALLYAHYGAKVVISDSRVDNGNDTVAKIKSKNGDATFIETDLSNPEECKELIKKTVDIYGSIDIACNNARIFSESGIRGDKKKNNSAWEAEVGLKGLLCCLKYEIEAMQKLDGGVIVNMAFKPGVINLTPFSLYSNPNDGMMDLLVNNPAEYPKKGIRINTVTPAYIDTALIPDKDSVEKKAAVRFSAEGGLRKLEKIAGLVVWLSTDEAPFASSL